MLTYQSTFQMTALYLTELRLEQLIHIKCLENYLPHAGIYVRIFLFISHAYFLYCLFYRKIVSDKYHILLFIIHSQELEDVYTLP